MNCSLWCLKVSDRNSQDKASGQGDPPRNLSNDQTLLGQLCPVSPRVDNDLSPCLTLLSLGSDFSHMTLTASQGLGEESHKED